MKQRGIYWIAIQRYYESWWNHEMHILTFNVTGP